MSKRRYGHKWCRFCNDYVTGNPLGYWSHMNKHVTNGEAEKVTTWKRGKRITKYIAKENDDEN